MGARHGCLCRGAGIAHDLLGIRRARGRHQSHVDGHVALVGHHVGAVTTFDLPKRDGRAAELGVGGQCRNSSANPADGLRHGGNGVCPTPGRAGVRGNAVHVDDVPGASLVRAARTAVGGLGVEDPAGGAQPTCADGGLRAAHLVLLVHGAHNRQRAPGQAPAPTNLVKRIRKGEKRAGQAALHVARAAAIELAIAQNGREGRRVLAPAGTHAHGVQVTEKCEVSGTVSGVARPCRGNERSQATASRQRLELFDLYGPGKAAGAHATTLQPCVYKFFDGPLEGTGIRALCAHEP